ncbi:MAG: ATP-binding cassette domain-containing protein [Firmicutes bacterium]|nr:ATP-binding cassette domain-containing protein [Bacillota bacterium]
MWPPDEGRIEFDGVDPWCLPETQRARIKQHIGYVPQALLLPQRLRVSAVFRYFAVLWGVEEKAAFRAMQTWGLASLCRQRVSYLLGGERQRLLLAVSELAQPSLWVLDELFRALDAEGAHQLEGRLATVTRGPHPVTVFLITHLFGPIERLWDKLLLLEHAHLAGQLTAADTGLTLTEAYRRLHIERR